MMTSQKNYFCIFESVYKVCIGTPCQILAVFIDFSSKSKDPAIFIGSLSWFGASAKILGIEHCVKVWQPLAQLQSEPDKADHFC